MQVRIEAQLLAPAKHMYIGGMNPFIAHFSGKEEVELNPWLLEDLLSDGPTTFDIRGASLIGECYSARTNIFRLNGHARSFSKSYLKRLSRLGWVIDHKALEHYHVTVMRKTCNRKLVPEISIGVFVRTTRPNPKLSREWTDEARND